LIFGGTRLKDMGHADVSLVPQLDRDPWVYLEVAYPVSPLAAAGTQVHAPILRGEPDLNAMWPASPTPDRGQVRIRFAGPSRQPLLLTSRYFGHRSNLLFGYLIPHRDRLGHEWSPTRFPGAGMP
jgi:hypothetical protein